MFICKYCYQTKINSNSLRNHERLCKNNSNKQSTYFQTNQEEVTKKRISAGCENQFTKAKKLGIDPPIVSEQTRRKLSVATTRNNKNRTEETFQKISASMKKAHAEGRAWNIGKSRWNNEPSYPENFFIQVIENEFSDKNYIREYPMGIYSIDFAWVEKKLAIEIDGDQHTRFESYRERDLRKDKFLQDSGWKVLRIVWKEMFRDTKKYILLSKNFIDCGILRDTDLGEAGLTVNQK